MTSLDDESVPTLVDAGELLTEKFEHNGSVQQQNSLRKVPITIVTGTDISLHKVYKISY